MSNADASIPADSNDLVLTPGGPRERSQVYVVEPGVAVDNDEATEMIELVELENGVIVGEMPAQPRIPAPMTEEGLSAYAFWMNATNTPLTRFVTNWQVPEAPKAQAAQTIFLGSGIQNLSENGDVIQPVLRWGELEGGKGRCWSIASWYLTAAGRTFHTEPVEVAPGAPLVGLVEMFVQAGKFFSYQCEFENFPSTRLPVLNIAEQSRCNVFLQAYGVEKRENLPPEETRVTGIAVQTEHASPTVDWTVHNPEKSYAQVKAAESGEVDISYSEKAP